MKTITIENSYQSFMTAQEIIEIEDLDIQMTSIKTALGDSVYEISGEAEEVEIFEEVYNMVF